MRLRTTPMTSQTSSRTIHIHAEAPAKPAWGAACNGCGVCCLAEPCPVGVLLSARRSGACDALVWDDEASIYRCGAVSHPQPTIARALPRGAQWLAGPLAVLLRRTARRWIAAGTGCDSSLEPHSGSVTM